MNDLGWVAFKGALGAGGQSIYKSNGVVQTLIADDSGEFDSFGVPGSINDYGVVAFNTVLDSGEKGIFIGDGSSTTPIAVDSDFDTSNPAAMVGATAARRGIMTFYDDR